MLRIRNVPRRRTNHQHKTRRPKVSNQATLAHRRKMRPPNELERNTNAFHDRRPVYDLAFTTMVAFAKIAEDLGFNELADSATALPNALIEATGIRENRRKGEQRMTRKEQLRKVRHLLVDLNSEIDESYRRDLKALLSKLLTLFKKAWDQQNDQIRRIKTENIQSNEEGRRNSLKEKPELTPMKDKIYVNEIKESLNAGEQIIKQVVAESGESAQKALTGHIEAVQRTIARR